MAEEEQAAAASMSMEADLEAAGHADFEATDESPIWWGRRRIWSHCFRRYCRLRRRNHNAQTEGKGRREGAASMNLVF